MYFFMYYGIIDLEWFLFIVASADSSIQNSIENTL